MYYRIMQDIAQPMSARCTQANWGTSFVPLFDENIAPNAYGIYSLRKIANQKGPVVRLRRASDGTERDFTAAELVGGVKGEELVDNSNWNTNPNNVWTVTGSLLSIDGSQTGTESVKQDGIIEHKQYIVSFDVTCNNYDDLWFQYLGTSASRFGANEMGITTDGSHSLLLDLTTADPSNIALFRFYVKQSGTIATLDNVSLREYTPSVAEEWVGETRQWRPYWRQAYETAYVTTWYDQSGSDIAQDMTQTNIAFQPRLIKAGVTDTNPDTDIPAIRFNYDGATTASFLYFNQPSFGETHMFAVYNSDDYDANFLYPHATGYGPVASFGNSTSALTSNFPMNLNESTYNSTSFNDRGIVNRGDYGNNIERGNTGLSYYKANLDSNWNINTKLGAYANSINTYNCNGWFSEVALISGYDSLSGLDVARVNAGISEYYKIPSAVRPIADDGNTKPSAAFSLRSLTGDTSKNVVRLRKSANGEEKDFKGSEVSNGTISEELLDNGTFDRAGADWSILSSTGGVSLSGGQASWTGTATSYAAIVSDTFSFDRKKYVIELDVTCNNFMAFNFQWGNSSIRFVDLGITSNGSHRFYVDMEESDSDPTYIRFYSDSINVVATLDNISIKEMTPSTVESWVMENGLSSAAGMKYGRLNSTTSNATVVTLYNQAGESNDATQPVVAQQPLLVKGALALMVGNKPAMLFDNVDDYLPFGNPGFSGGDPHSVYAAVSPLSESSSGGAYFGNLSGSRTTAGTVLDLCPENVFYIRVSGNSFYGTGTDDNSGHHLFSVLFNSDATSVFDYKVYREGVEVNQVSGSSDPVMNLNPNGEWALGASQEQSDSYYNGYIQEVIVYNENHQPKDRTIIEANMNGYYGIYLDDPWYDLNSWNDDLSWS